LDPDPSLNADANQYPDPDPTIKVDQVKNSFTWQEVASVEAFLGKYVPVCIM
jgi:hypothetical protein